MRDSLRDRSCSLEPSSIEWTLSMAKTPLFSTYRQGENRVTSSMMAVFERIGIGYVERLLAAASGESSLAIVTFVNQYATGAKSVPDAAITANCRYLFEVKTARGALRPDQLAAHAASLTGSADDERLFVITPDPAEPAVIGELGRPDVVWFNFLALSQAIDELLADPTELVSEQTRFLLRELQALFAEDGLLGHRDTVVVAARIAWPEYRRYGAYICQPNRAFQEGVRWIAFYAGGEIQPRVPQILARRDNVAISEETVASLAASTDPTDAAMADLIGRLISDGSRREGTISQVFLLSGCEDDRTLRLPKPVRNTTRDRNGQPWAWTLGQRYTRSDILATGPETTGELEARGG